MLDPRLLFSPGSTLLRSGTYPHSMRNKTHSHRSKPGRVAGQGLRIPSPHLLPHRWGGDARGAAPGEQTGLPFPGRARPESVLPTDAHPSHRGGGGAPELPLSQPVLAHRQSGPASRRHPHHHTLAGQNKKTPPISHLSLLFHGPTAKMVLDFLNRVCGESRTDGLSK